MDVAVTWIGAAGCLVYLWTLYRNGRRGAGAQRFLIWVLAGLLSVRGFDWLTPSHLLDRLTFALATGLPLAITLFLERILRRHHPLWVKLFALATSGVFLPASLVVSAAHYSFWLAAFATSLTLVILVNGALLLGRDRQDLAAGENRLANLLILIALVSAVLVVTDFRPTTGIGSVRLGAIAALVFVYSLLGCAIRNAGGNIWATRWLLLLALAAVMSALLALATQSQSIEQWRGATLATWPITYAWLLLTGIVVYSRDLQGKTETDDFLRWLARAPLHSAQGFAAFLASAPDAAAHLLLEEDELADYDAGVMTQLSANGERIVSLAGVREIRRKKDHLLMEPADQWFDLLQRTQMTHGFMVSQRPPAIFLLHLPAATPSSAAEQRLRVMEHICQQLELR